MSRLSLVRHFVFVAGVLGCASLVHAGTIAPSYSIRTLGSIGGRASYSTALNDSGQVAGNAETAAGDWHAFFWDSATGMQDLGTIGRGSMATGISNSGLVTGTFGTRDQAYTRSFLWSSQTGMTDLGVQVKESQTQPNRGAVVSFIFSDVVSGGVNDAGQVAGYYRICGAVGYAYNIGKYEVTAGQYSEFLNKVAKTDTHELYSQSMWSDSNGCQIQRSGSPGSYSYNVASDLANRPVNYVSWGDAARFANWLHNGQPTGAQEVATTEDGAYHLDGVVDLQTVSRKSGAKWAITSEDEWYKAAYYKGGSTNAGYWDYPTGSDLAPIGETPPGHGGPTRAANYIAAVGHLTDVGAYMESPSPYGTFDQGGNLWEWNESVIYENSYDCRAQRGGSFHDYYHDNDLRAGYRGSGNGPTFEHSSLGFRVAEVPEPATLSLLVLSGLAVIRKRRK